MSKRGNLIVAPVGLEEVADTLNEVQDVGTVCSSTNINGFSKRKPIRATKFEVLEEADFKNANYGFRIPTFTQPTNVSGQGALWTYERPWGKSGGIIYPYRLSDFDGYYHDAPDPKPILLAQSIKPNTPNVDFNIDLQTPLSVLDAGAVSFSDLVAGGVSLSNMYLGIVLTKGANDTFFCTDTTRGLSSGTLKVRFPVTLSGQYNAFLVGSSVSYVPTASSSIPNATYISLGQGFFVPITFEQPQTAYYISPQIIISRLRIVDGTYVGWCYSGTVLFGNNGNVSVTFPSMRLYLLRTNTLSNNLPTQDNIVSYYDIGNITVSANNSVNRQIPTIVISESEANSANYVYVVSTQSGMAGTYNSGTPAVVAKPSPLI